MATNTNQRFGMHAHKYDVIKKAQRKGSIQFNLDRGSSGELNIIELQNDTNTLISKAHL